MLYLFGFVVVFFSVIPVFVYMAQVHKWNGGVCRNCKTDWMPFSNSSLGFGEAEDETFGNGYHCKNFHYTFISYGADKKRRLK